MTSEPIHDAESVPKLYGNPGMLGFFTHAQAVSTRLSFFESLGTRLLYGYTQHWGEVRKRAMNDLEPIVGSDQNIITVNYTVKLGYLSCIHHSRKEVFIYLGGIS